MDVTHKCNSILHARLKMVCQILSSPMKTYASASTITYVLNFFAEEDLEKYDTDLNGTRELRLEWRRSVVALLSILGNRWVWSELPDLYGQRSSPYTSTSDINYIGLDGVTLGHKSYLSYATNISKWKYIWDVNNWGTILVHLHSGVCVWQSCLADQIFIIYVSHNWTIEMIPICLIERTIIDSQRKRTSASRVASLRIINGQNDLLRYSWEWY